MLAVPLGRVPPLTRLFFAVVTVTLLHKAACHCSNRSEGSWTRRWAPYVPWVGNALPGSIGSLEKLLDAFDGREGNEL